jgi:lipopolysaccharide/colanic/teichoic acid biosynthesis glycosyltransferase
MQRIVEFFVALTALIILLPLFVLIALGILMDSTGGVFFSQKRVGKNNSDFTIYKFRTMVPGASKSGLLTTGHTDQRVTRFGTLLRNYKLDELPQLYNILTGDMSFVGPRPEVRKYVSLYTPEQRKVLTVRPGLTDYASLEYINEGAMLASRDDPEKAYVENIMPAKLALNLKYLEEKSPGTDLRIILKTIKRLVVS